MGRGAHPDKRKRSKNKKKLARSAARSEELSQLHDKKAAKVQKRQQAADRVIGDIDQRRSRRSGR